MSFSISLPHISFNFVIFMHFCSLFIKFLQHQNKKLRSRFRIMVMFWSKLLTSCSGTLTLKFLNLSLKIPWKHLEFSTEKIVRTLLVVVHLPRAVWLQGDQRPLHVRTLSQWVAASSSPAQVRARRMTCIAERDPLHASAGQSIESGGCERLGWLFIGVVGAHFCQAFRSTSILIY